MYEYMNMYMMKHLRLKTCLVAEYFEVKSIRIEISISCVIPRPKRLNLMRTEENNLSVEYVSVIVRKTVRTQNQTQRQVGLKQKASFKNIS